MVAVKSYEADRFLARPPAHVFLYLVFGTDAGLVSERKQNILRQSVSDPSDAFQLVHLAGDDIAADPLRLLDEANSISLFGGKRAISIDVGDQDGLRVDAGKLHDVLDTYKIVNSYEVYQGTHTSEVADRFQNHVIPFFSKNLCFENDCK